MDEKELDKLRSLIDKHGVLDGLSRYLKKATLYDKQKIARVILLVLSDVAAAGFDRAWSKNGLFGGWHHAEAADEVRVRLLADIPEGHYRIHDQDHYLL